MNFLPLAIDIRAFATNWSAGAVCHGLESQSGGSPTQDVVSLVVPSGPRRCCGCPDHNENDVSLSHGSWRVSVETAQGARFGSSPVSCAVGVRPLAPSRAIGDAPVCFTTNGAPYRKIDYTVLGLGFERSDWVPLSRYNELSPTLGYPFAAHTNFDYGASLYVRTDVLLSNGVFRLALENVTGKFRIWHDEIWENWDQASPRETILDSETRRVRHFTARQWRRLVRRLGYGGRVFPVYLTSSEPGSCDLVLSYANVENGRKEIMLFANAGCASERLCVSVTDDEGRPVTNATVYVGFEAGHVVLAEGPSRHYSAKTDTNGNAVVKFNGANSDVYWSVMADGFYPSGFRKTVYQIDVVQIPPLFYKVNMLEHEKHVEARLWRKVNPQPMYSYRLSEAYGNMINKVPVKNGRYGFDLKLGSWLPPIGKGEVADFYYVRNIGQPPAADGGVSWLEFEPGGGAYFGYQTGCKEFPSTYGADTNAVFKSRLPFMFAPKSPEETLVDWRDIVSPEEYAVLRTRVKMDAEGNVVEANYSKILGPFRFGYAVESPCVVFNHRVNDPNLESDCSINMLREFNSCAYPP